MNNIVIICCDCGAEQTGNGKPKDVARKHHWSHAAQGRWRCDKCQDFQDRVASAMPRLVVGRE